MNLNDSDNLEYIKPKNDVLFNMNTSRTVQTAYYEMSYGYFNWSFDKMPWRVCGLYQTTNVQTDLDIVTVQYSYPGTLYASSFTDKDNMETKDVIDSELITKGYGYRIGWFKKSDDTSYDDVEPSEQNYINSQKIPTDWISDKIINNKSYEFLEICEAATSVGALNIIPMPEQGKNSKHWFNWSFSYNIPIFSTKEECILYVNGIIDESTAILPPPEKDDNDENDDDGRNHSSDNQDSTPVNTPQVAPFSVKGGCNYYCVNAPNVSAFTSWLWNDIIKEDNISDFLFNSLTGICDNLYQCVTGCMLFPVNIKNHLATVTTVPINLGRYTSELSVLDASTYNCKVGECDYKFTHKYGNFLDYPPYVSALLYLPYVGQKPIDLNLFCADNNEYATMHIECYVDITTGAIDYMIFKKNKKGMSLVSSYQGSCGCTIPLSYDNGSAMVNNVTGSLIKQGISTIATTGASVVGSGAKGGIDKEDMITGVADAINSNVSTPVEYNVGSPTPCNGLYYPQRPIVLISRPTYNRPDTYGKNIGYPCFKSYVLKNLTGFTKVINPKLTFGDSKTAIDNTNNKRVFPTETEINEIKQLLETGVYI